ncbi:S8 family serine peptidase [Sphingobium nicotianae]|uniref:S8 family serine peptidase n=1 Tax=Sphingobium nicotianae TaxID=2782607 RepID=A0A9X1DC84_9SPHN|nr:S8 family serine peptidase [Sphingobium nicotianae]MBT2187450.1 S8 family serine peptidase [Sphingobium nicotianae]
MRRLFVSILLLGLAVPVMAQIGLPQPGRVLDPVIGAVDRTLDRTLDATRDLANAATTLARDRVRRLTGIARANPERIELDDHGEPARRGVVLLLDPDAASLAAVRKLGFTATPVEGLDALGLATAELTAPQGMSLPRALKQLRKALPGKSLSADVLHFESASAAAPSGGATVRGATIDTPVGLIDGGVAAVVPVADRRGFAPGAPAATDHGTAVAGLLRDAGVHTLFAADVYGRDPAGGTALAIARALGWLVEKRTRVVSISLVGPRNPLLERAIAATLARGVTVLAAVGNDGPSAPPAFPASYPGVFAITAVDGRDRALIEAGRASHLDYAAPGADISALNAAGARRPVRGTSFATPLAAARAAAAVDHGKPVRATLDAEAKDLGRKGPDDQFGRGLLCGDCTGR